MSAKEKPAHVKRAIVTDNLEQLRVSGAAGAKKTNEIKKVKKDQSDAVDKYFGEKKLADETLRVQSANEHIVPIDDSPQGNQFTPPEYRHPEQP